MIKAIAHGGFGIVILGAVLFGPVTGVANAKPVPPPPPNPGGYYGSAYQDLITDPNLVPGQDAYDDNGSFILENMFGMVCNNPGFICT